MEDIEETVSSGHITGAIDVNSQNGQREESEHDLPSLYNYQKFTFSNNFFIYLLLLLLGVYVRVCLCACVRACVCKCKEVLFTMCM